ncbi:MAG: hypothetical protein WBB07_18380 [Mycobacterium sp.]
MQDAANGLATLPAFVPWGGEAADAAKEAIGRTRADLNAHGFEALAVANAARSAADEIERIKAELATLKSDAAALGMEIDPVSGRVVATAGFAGSPIELLLKQEQLQPRVDKLIAEANVVDIALANAIDMAGGTSPTFGPAASGPNVALSQKFLILPAEAVQSAPPVRRSRVPGLRQVVDPRQPACRISSDNQLRPLCQSH